MRRHHLLVACAASATVVAAFAVLPQAAARETPAGDMPHQDAPSPCVVTHTKTASPNVLLLGETVGVTLTFRAHCPSEHLPRHIALVLDGSATMSGEKNQLVRKAGARLIRKLNMPSDPWTKVGVVAFNTRARRLRGLTNDENRAVASVDRVGASGGTRIDLGIEEGLRVISQGRPGLDRDEISEAMVVISDGLNDAGCAPVLSAARQAKGQGILLAAVCVGHDCDEQCMRQVASLPRYYFREEYGGIPLDVFGPRRAPMPHGHLRKLTVNDALPDWMEYVPESTDPPQSSPDDPDRWLKWETEYARTDGVTYTFTVRPLKTGFMPTNTEATGELIDNKGRSLAWVFDVPWVTVLDPAALPTPLATPTPSPTATATSTPSPIATPSVQSLHLPRVLRLE